MRLCGLAAHPRAVLPVVSFDVVIFGSVPRPCFEMKRVRVAFKNLFAAGGFYAEFISIEILQHKRKESLPYPFVDLFQGVFSGLPIVEIAGDRHRNGVRRPDAARHARAVIRLCPMHSQIFVRPDIAPLMKGIQWKLRCFFFTSLWHCKPHPLRCFSSFIIPQISKISSFFRHLMKITRLISLII